MTRLRPGAPAAAPPPSRPGRRSAPAVAPSARRPRGDHNATLILSTTPDKVKTVSDRAIPAVDALGGFVQTSEVNSSGNSASATLTVKIPAAKLDSGIAQLSKLAHVKARSQQDQDVTDQREALEAAVRDARADRAGTARSAEQGHDRCGAFGLRAQLDRATRRVTRRQRRSTSWTRAVSYATVELAIEGDRSGASLAARGPLDPGGRLGDAVRVLEGRGRAMIALAVLLPLALVAALAAVAGRVLVRRRRERALDIA